MWFTELAIRALVSLAVNTCSCRQILQPNQGLQTPISNIPTIVREVAKEIL
jgi:hypothetical protein